MGKKINKYINNSKEEYSIWAENLFASYNGKENVLKDINLKLNKGEIISILGPNGAGKSTLFYLLTGMKKASKGELLIFGRNVKEQCKKNNIAYVPQSEQIDWDYPVRVWDVVLGGRFGHILSSKGFRRFLPPGWAGNDHLNVVENALKAVNMLEYKKRPIGALSGGQKKRIFLARTIAQDAQLLLLDEPLVGVDQKSTELIMNVLTQMRKEGKTIIMISHDLNKVKKYAQKVILLNHSIIALGSTKEILGSDELNSIYSINPDINKIEKDSEYKEFLIKNKSDEVLTYVD
ncbi:metal ABC transporter ATP-binding protein [Natronospora cellulosivora (SeqCode)]